MTPARCPGCGEACLVSLDDVTSWSAVKVSRRRLVRGRVVNNGKPKDTYGERIATDHDLICRACSWSGPASAVIESEGLA